MKRNIGALMRQAEQMQENMQKAQEELAQLEVDGRVRRRHGQGRR
jgi:nucleoid-associated protein EbfC